MSTIVAFTETWYAERIEQECSGIPEDDPGASVARAIMVAGAFVAEALLAGLTRHTALDPDGVNVAERLGQIGNAIETIAEKYQEENQN
jgi:hypothetical protein